MMPLSVVKPGALETSGCEAANGAASIFIMGVRIMQEAQSTPDARRRPSVSAKSAAAKRGNSIRRIFGFTRSSNRVGNVSKRHLGAYRRSPARGHGAPAWRSGRAAEVNDRRR